jgi:hypothetical protein
MNPTKPAMASGTRASRVIRVFDRPEGPTMMAWEPQLACRASRAVHGGKATARAALHESPGQRPMERAALVTDRSLEVRRSIPSESDQFVQKGPGVAPGNLRPHLIHLATVPNEDWSHSVLDCCAHSSRP